MNNLEIVKNQMGPVAIDNNYRNNNNWGILFNTIQSPENYEWGPTVQDTGSQLVSKDEAWIVGETFMCRWTDFGKFEYNPETPFLNFDESCWTRNTLSTSIDSTNNKVIVTPQMLHERLDRVRPKSNEERHAIAAAACAQGAFMRPEDVPTGANIKIRVPYGNLYNLLGHHQSKQERDRIRVIIKSNMNPMDEVVKGATLLISEMHPVHGIVMKIWEPARQQLFPNVSPDKFYIIDPGSPISADRIAPGQMYQCFFGTNEAQGITLEEKLEMSTMVEVRYRLFKGIEIFSHTSTAGFLMNETIEEVLDSKRYKDDDVLRIPYINPFNQNEQIDPMYFNFPPIHIDCNTLFNILDLYRGFEWIEINVAPNAMHPILINGVKADDGFPTIQSVIAPLKAMKGDVR